MADRVFVIAEAGVNHNGSRDIAVQLIDVAARSGADAVKFQTFRAERVVTVRAPKAAYQSANTGEDGTQLDMIRKLELSAADFRTLAAHANARGIEFMSTPFDSDSLDFLIRDIGVKRVKIASGEITNAPFLLAAAACGLPLIVSTGMSTLAEVEEALAVIAFGLSRTAGAPSQAAFREAFRSAARQQALEAIVTLLHCTTEYPAPMQDVNLRAMQTLRTHFGLVVGYSDHTQGTSISVAATALGAAVIEKHFTLDRSLPGPDHRASLEPDELRDMVSQIRAVSAALGVPEKKPAPSEIPNILIARRSVVAARAIRRGEIFSLGMLDTKRPGGGLSPMRVFELIGKPSPRDYAPDEALEP